MNLSFIMFTFLIALPLYYHLYDSQIKILEITSFRAGSFIILCLFHDVMNILEGNLVWFSL